MPDIQLHQPFWFENATNNGDCTWDEEWLRQALGYADKRSFKKVVLRAIKACVTLEIDPSADFRLGPDGAYKFSRVACFLIAMNSDSKKREVASVQMHLAKIANAVASHLDQAAGVERVLIRDEVAEGMKSLAKTAKDKGVNDFGRFMNAGYRGMYNMNLEELRKHKGVPVGEELIDRMDRHELAANFFRVTSTEERMKTEFITGQEAAEQTAEAVGRIVRNAMLESSGTKPEDIPIAEENIRDTRKGLKTADRSLRAYDKRPKMTRLLDTIPADAKNPPDPGYTRDPEVDDVERDDE